jgi:MtN3 and saliva related transmembrane protein
MTTKFIDILGYIAITLVSFNLFPQIYSIIKHKSAKVISYVTYSMTLVSSFLLVIYAYNLKLYPILIGNCMVFLSSALILYLKHLYG